jgi:hypothetical protein
MTQFPHDQFAKEYLKELLSPLGQVETGYDVVSERREFDVWFVPTQSPIQAILAWSIESLTEILSLVKSESKDEVLLAIADR